MQYDVKIKKLPKSEVEMEVKLPPEFLTDAKKKALEKFGKEIEMPGFRKGHVPENVLKEKIGEATLMEEASEIILQEHFPKIINQENLDIIGRPRISITKLAIGNPMEFKANFSILPSFELPDYKKVASDENSKKLADPEVTEKEIDDVLLQIRKNKAHVDWHQAHKNEDHHNHPELDKEENLPALDDELAKSAGNFKNLDELKIKIKENIIEEKKHRNIEKKRASIMESLLIKTKIDLPEILVESEIEKSLAQMKDDIGRMGGKWEDYLVHIKKKEKDLRKDLRDSSEKKAKIQLIFNKIAETEKLEPNKEILEQEVKHIIEHYKDASETNARIYVATMLLNQEVLKLLES